MFVIKIDCNYREGEKQTKKNTINNMKMYSKAY